MVNRETDQESEWSAVSRLSEAAKQTNDPVTGGVAQARGLKLIGPNTTPEMLRLMGMDKAQDAVRGTKDDKKH